MTRSRVTETRVLNGSFSAAPKDWEPHGTGTVISKGIRLYVLPPGASEFAHSGKAHLIDLHGAMQTRRLSIGSDRLERRKVPEWSAAFIPSGCDLRLDVVNTEASLLLFVEPQIWNSLAEQPMTSDMQFWRRDTRLAQTHRWLTHAANDRLLDAITLESAVLRVLECVAGWSNARPVKQVTRRQHRSAVSVAIDLLEARLEQTISIGQLAAAVGMAPFHFSRAFAVETGETPRQYLIRRRLEEAQTLLRSTGDPITEIALSTGFASQAHLTATMRRALGITPGTFRAETK